MSLIYWSDKHQYQIIPCTFAPPPARKYATPEIHIFVNLVTKLEVDIFVKIKWEKSVWILWLCAVPSGKNGWKMKETRKVSRTASGWLCNFCVFFVLCARFLKSWVFFIDAGCPLMGKTTRNQGQKQWKNKSNKCGRHFTLDLVEISGDCKRRRVASISHPGRTPGSRFRWRRSQG